MSLLSKKDFAACVGISRQQLAVYHQRKKIIYSGKLIDTTNEVNIAFMKEKEIKNAKKGITAGIKEIVAPVVKELPEEVKPREPKKRGNRLSPVAFGPISTPDEKSRQIEKSFSLDNKEQELKIQKAEIDLRLAELKMQKAEGEVVPVQPIVPIVMQYGNQILMAQKAADDKILTDIAHKYDISSADIVKIRKDWVDERNRAMKEANINTKKAIEIIVIEHSERKAPGEK